MFEEDMRRTAGPVVLAHSHGIPVTIEEHCRKDMWGWCRATNLECSGMGLVKLINGEFHVYKVFLPQQVGSSGGTDITLEGRGGLQYYLHKKGLPPEDLRFWWHTHPTFNVFWSGTDDNEAQRVAAGNEEWSLSLVINQKGEYKCRADFMKPVRIMVDELKPKWVTNTGMQAKHNYKKEVARWVKPWVPPARTFLYKDIPQRYGWICKDIKQEKVVEKEASKYVTFGGLTFLSEVFEKIMECGCGDFTCPDCKEVLREVNSNA